MFKVSSRLYAIGFHSYESNLSTEAIDQTKPNVHKSEAAGLKQEVAQEEGNAPVWPATVHQQ